MTTADVDVIEEVARQYVQFIFNTIDHIQCLHQLLPSLDPQGLNGVKVGLFKEHLAQIVADPGMQINDVYLDTMLGQVGRTMAMQLEIYENLYEPVVYFRPRRNSSLRSHLLWLWRDCDQVRFILYPSALDEAVCLIYETKFLIEMLIQP